MNKDEQWTRGTRNRMNTIFEDKKISLFFSFFIHPSKTKKSPLYLC